MTKLIKEERNMPTDELIMRKEDAKVINNLIRDFSPLIILWFLMEEKLYGNAMINRINSFFPTDSNITGPSRIYPTLHKLEEKGHIVGTWQLNGKQRIRYYEITEEGKKEFQHMKQLFKHYVTDDLKEFLNEMIF